MAALRSGRGPFESGKLCPPCGDLQRQKLEQAQLLLVEAVQMRHVD